MTMQTVHIIQAHNGMEIIDGTMYATRRLLEMEKFEKRWKRKTKKEKSTLQKFVKRLSRQRRNYDE